MAAWYISQCWHLWASCLQMGRPRLPKINPNLYAVPRIIVRKFQKDWSSRSWVMVKKKHIIYIINLSTDEKIYRITQLVFFYNNSVNQVTITLPMDFSSLPHGLVKGPFPNKKIFSNHAKFPKFSFLPPYFDYQMANLSIKNFPKWYQKYHSQNTLTLHSFFLSHH